MSFLGSMFSGDRGTGWQGQATPIQRPVTNAQAQTAYGQAQQGLHQQQAFVNALQPGGAQGLANQQFLGNQLQQQALGAGPNPALNQLNQTTAANTANTAALMGSARGSSSNPGLIARQAGMAGAANQQQAAGQAATMRAQQQLAAQQNLAGLSGVQVGQQAGGINNLNTSTQAEQAALLGSINAQNQAAVSQQNAINAANAGIANTNAQGQQGIIGGILGGAGAAAGLAQGGEVHRPLRMADGGNPLAEGADQFSSGVGRHLAETAAGNIAPQAAPQEAAPQTGPAALQQGTKDFIGGIGKLGKKAMASSPAGGGGGVGFTGAAMMAAEGGKVPALLSPGEKYLSPKEAKKVADGKASPDKIGKKVPGKAKVPGDNEVNDTVSASLEEGGIVIPRSIINSEHAIKHSIAFVRSHLSRASKLKSKK